MDIQQFIDKVLPALVSLVIASIVSLGGLFLNIREHRQKSETSKRSDLEKDYERVKSERDELLKEKAELEKENEALKKRCEDCPQVARVQSALDTVLARVKDGK